MSRQKTKAKLYFKATHETLKEAIECNSISQVLIAFNYVERWGEHKKVISYIPDDAKNVQSFFKDIRKLSSDSFQVKKFKDIWDKYNMSDITDYTLLID